MMLLNPGQLFSGVVLVVAPHMDDEVLACGGSLAGLPDKNKVYVVYATDGKRSPVRTAGAPSPDLVAIREGEAREALSVLGIPEPNIRFLGLPDGHLRQYVDRLAQALAGLIHSIQPDQILVPFRYDRHPDHLALNRATAQAAAQWGSAAKMYEYFVYYRYRLLPGGDIRNFILPDLTINIDTRAWSELKREALLRYRSQTTLFYHWQSRPILPPKRIEEVSQQQEIFLASDPGFPGASVFGKAKTWIRLVHLIEPQVKNGKERLLDLLKAGRTSNDGQGR